MYDAFTRVFALPMILAVIVSNSTVVAAHEVPPPRPTSQPWSVNGPFGKLDERDYDLLMQFAKQKGIDLYGDIVNAYQNQDAEALGRVFKFSVNFDRLDGNARMYGQLIGSSFVNLGEWKGVEWYAKVVADQDPQVRQRIRDLLNYQTADPERRRVLERSNREDYPALFPADYEFARDDPLFAPTTKPTSLPTTRAMAPRQ